MSRWKSNWSIYLMILFVGAMLRFHALPEVTPGVHYDEAANGVLISDIAFREYRPIFITSYTGKEVLFFYWAGAITRLVGSSLFTMRLSSALIGMLTIAATIWLARELFPRRRGVAMWTALFLATHFVHLLFSHLGFRAVTQPLLQSLSLAGLLMAIRTRKIRHALLAGCVLGLAAYTYLAIRLFPLVILLWMIALLWRANRQRLSLLLSYGVSALAVATPLLLYFWRNPETFWVRIGQVSADVTPLTYLQNYWRVFLMLFWRGDPYIRFNLPDLPLLSPLLAIAFLIGLAMMIKRREPNTAMVVGAILIMLLPTALAINEITPSNIRAIGLFPFFLLPVAYGADFLASRWKRGELILIAMGVIGLGGLTAQQYFVQWGQNSELFYATDADLVAVSDYLDHDAPKNRPIYLAALHHQHPTVAFSSRRYDEVKWLVNGEAFVQPPQPSLLIYPHAVPPPTWLERYLPAPIAMQAGPDGQPLFRAYQIDQPIRWQGGNSADVNFDNVLRLVRDEIVQINPTSADVTLEYEVIGKPTSNYRPFVHIEDENGYRWGEKDSHSYAADQWQQGERIIYRLEIPLQAGMPTKKYRVHVGLFDGKDRLPVVVEGQGIGGSTWVIEDVALQGNSADSGVRPTHLQNQLFSNGVNWLGYERGPDSAETGTPYPLSLWWQFDQPTVLSTTIYLESADDQIVWSQSVITAGTGLAIDRIRPKIPVTLATGDYTATMKVDLPNMASIQLFTLQITETQRLFEPPAFETSSEVVFGNEIRLLGYTLAPLTNQQTELTLIWQAVTPPTHTYTVFVHLLRPDGSCCLWQADQAPVQNSYPTSRWISAEVVIDTYPITLEKSEKGEYPIEIGLYIAENGQRLKIDGQNENSLAIQALIIR